MARSRREFTPEYKDEAVKLVVTTGRAVATVAGEFGVNEATLGRWVTAFKARNETGQTEVTGYAQGMGPWARLATLV